MGEYHLIPINDGVALQMETLSAHPTAAESSKWMLYKLGNDYFAINDVGVIVDLGGQNSLNVSTVTQNVTVTTEDVILANAISGPITVTLPAIAAMRPIIVKKIDATINEVLIKGPSGETIDGDSFAGTKLQNVSLQFTPDGVNWWITQMFIPPDNVTREDLVDLLEEMILELAKQNVHLKAITNERVGDADIITAGD